MEISKMITISITHIMERTATELEEDVGKIDLSVYKKKEYGFFVYIPDDWEDGCNIPADLTKCIKLAYDNGCEWLCMDRDGEIISELPVYEWE